METLIIYLSKHGTAQKASRLIQKFLSPDNNVTTINLSHDNVPELSNYDRIIIGTSIYVGKGRRSFAKFCTNEYINLFAHKDLGLFLCGLEEDYQKQQKQLESVFSERLLRHAKAKAFVGGEIIISKLNCLERLTVRTILKITTDVSTLDENIIEEFVRKMEK